MPTKTRTYYHSGSSPEPVFFAARDGATGSGTSGSQHIFSGIGGYGQVGDLIYDSVMLDGRQLFNVATKASQDESNRLGTAPLDIRITRIENRLDQLIEGEFSPRRRPNRRQSVE
jgi:hypothetical protein